MIRSIGLALGVKTGFNHLDCNAERAIHDVWRDWGVVEDPPMERDVNNLTSTSVVDNLEVDCSAGPPLICVG
jgi:hypothetical protein